MVSVCFYFQVHQPYRLKNYQVFDIGHKHDYFDHQKNKEIMEKVTRKCYLPMNNLLLNLIRKHQGAFKISFSLTGTFIDQAMEYAPEVIESFKELAKTGCVEFLDETYYHSLSYLQSKQEFKEQLLKHREIIKKLFGQTPKVFRNTELVYNNELAKFTESLGYNGILAEGADHILGWRTPNFIYTPKTCQTIKLLLKNYKLSDDIAFRFSNKGWKDHPLTCEKFTDWVNQANGNGDLINLFMDYETFGEHQWEDTGIFQFMEHLPTHLLQHPDNNFKTVSEALQSFPPRAELDIHHYISWADVERDLSAWLGNRLQNSAIQKLFELEEAIKKSNNPKLLEDWRKLTTSDHYYYMCTKWFNDGDVHKYFNPYDSPYDCYIAFMNVISDIQLRLKEENKELPKITIPTQS